MTRVSAQQGILQALYALFLGAIITAFLAVSLMTFYPPPTVDTADVQEEIADLYDCQATAGCELTLEQRQQLRDLERESEAAWEQQQVQEQAWSRNAGLLFIGLATGLLALSLVRTDRAIVLSNGLLLGGLFTMVGGIGLSVAGGAGLARFLVLAVALGITVVLGYLRFARRDAPAAAAPSGELELRVGALEDRFEDLRRALGS